MKCIFTILYSVIMNWRITERFRPSRGLCQGDPLSTFLFLICSEGLSSLMRLAIMDDLIKEEKAIRNGYQGDNCSGGEYTLKGLKGV